MSTLDPTTLDDLYVKALDLLSNVEPADQLLIERMIERAWAAIETYVDTDLLSTDRTELYDTETPLRMLALRRFPVQGVDLIAVETIEALRVSYTGTAPTATVEITDTSVKLRARAGTVTENELLFSTMTTTSTMAVAIGATVGWTATAPNNVASSLLMRRGATRIKSNLVGFDAWEGTDEPYEIDYPAGVIIFTNGMDFEPYTRRARIDYTAGYVTIPADIEAVLLSLVKGSWDRVSRDASFQSERLGDYSYTIADGAGAAGGEFSSFGEVAMSLSKYRRILP